MLKNARIIPYLPATNLERARNFYEDKIGLVPRDAGEEGVLYTCGEGSVCFLYVSQFAGTNKASQAYWEVDDVEREVAELKTRGVVFEEYDLPGIKTKNGIANPGGGPKIAWFKDTEGNILAVTERG